MIISFKVSNFRSFNTEQELCFVTKERQRSKSLNQNYTELYGQKILKSAVLFGANASGKSNLIKALDWFKNFAISSFKNSNENPEINFEEFLLDQKNQDQPASFELDFILGGKDRYVYRFAVTKTAVVSEELIRKLKTKDKSEVIYTRSSEKIVLKKANEIRKVYKDTVKNDVLFLSVLASSKDELANNIIDKIRKISILNSKAMLNVLKVYTARNYSKYKNRIDGLVLESDLGIERVNIKDEVITVKKMEEDFEMNGKLSPALLRALQESQDVTKTSISTIHKGLSKDGTSVDVEFNFNDESDGTQRLFNLAGLIANTLEDGRVLVIDELDVHLHPEVCKFILLQFHQNNSKNAQLLFSSHSVSLLDSDFLRRDQIWFAQKDRSGATELYSLADLSERNDTDYAKRYLDGRYGAIPYISSLVNYRDQND